MAKVQRGKAPNKVHIKIISAEGKCPNGHKVGDEWTINRKTPDGICLAAFWNLLNPIRILECNGEYPMYKDPDSYQTCCPDVGNKLVFEIRRLPGKTEAPDKK